MIGNIVIVKKFKFNSQKVFNYIATVKYIDKSRPCFII